MKKGHAKQFCEGHWIPGNQIRVTKGTIAKGERHVVLDTKVDCTKNIHHLVTQTPKCIKYKDHLLYVDRFFRPVRILNERFWKKRGIKYIVSLSQICVFLLYIRHFQ